MANLYWLLQDVDEYEGYNVKKRVAQAVRAKGKKPLLNIHDKALLNKPADARTEKEKHYLYRILGNLKCFRRYPRVVKKKLAAVAYYRYYGPGRTIVRENQEGHALYFIVNGNVNVSQLVWDEVGQQYQSVDLWDMHTGDIFGEVSLLHNIKRTATCSTTSHCELLALMRDDFKSVLQNSLQRQWNEIQTAMSAFTYFDSLDEVARREGYIVAKMKSYSENDTILGDGVGARNYVFFILSGRCQMIESLQIIVRQDCGRQFYTLYDPYVCQLQKGATFGFGENMRDRRIIALTPVECMLLPKTWLLQRNTANIWTRVQYYLQKKIPTKKQLFEKFVSTRHWQVFKNQVVQDVLGASKTHADNSTSIHDVPYSIRMEEMVHI